MRWRSGKAGSWSSCVHSKNTNSLGRIWRDSLVFSHPGLLAQAPKQWDAFFLEMETKGKGRRRMIFCKGFPFFQALKRYLWLLPYLCSAWGYGGCKSAGLLWGGHGCWRSGSCIAVDKHILVLNLNIFRVQCRKAVENWCQIWHQWGFGLELLKESYAAFFKINLALDLRKFTSTDIEKYQWKYEKILQMSILYARILTGRSKECISVALTLLFNITDFYVRNQAVFIFQPILETASEHFS